MCPWLLGFLKAVYSPSFSLANRAALLGRIVSWKKEVEGQRSVDIMGSCAVKSRIDNNDTVRALILSSYQGIYNLKKKRVAYL